MKIVVLGSTGMLGHKMVERLQLHYPDVRGISREDGLDATDLNGTRQILGLLRPEVVINCVGVIKQRSQNPKQSIAVNALFPHFLREVCSYLNANLIHFSTDCVFSGYIGNYTELDETDPIDLYGQTKVLGEVTNAENALTFRTSIVGRERDNYLGLLEWFLRQEESEIMGFQNAIWSGVTTNWLSDTVATLLKRKLPSGLYQVAASPISKLRLLQLFEETYDWPTVITPALLPIPCDRSLRSDKFEQDIGIKTPTLEELIVMQRDQDKRSGYAF